MATDYVTSPITPNGKLVFGCLLGILTFIFRMYGGSAEGVSYAIIFSNLLVPLIDKKGRTVGKIILKIQRIKRDNFKIVTKLDKVSIFLLSTLEVLPILMFIPWISAGFAGIFSLSYLFYISAVGFLYDIAALFNVSQGRAYYMVKNAKSSNLGKIKANLEDLVILDADIKSGKIKEDLGLELFFLK